MSELFVSRVSLSTTRSQKGKIFYVPDQVFDQINIDHMKIVFCIQLDMLAGLTQYSRIN